MNIVVLMLDSLRPDTMGCGGHPQVKTPHLDRLAADGIIFQRAYAEYPVTVPSRTALVSGCYTWTNRPWCPLRSYDMHVAELLRDAGYVTACFSDAPMNRGAALDRGFDTFQFFDVGKCHRHDDFDFEPDTSHAYFPPRIAQKEEQFYRNTLKGRELARRRYGKTCPELLFDSALEWLQGNHTQPFFLWIDSFEPHEPWAPPSPYYEMYGADQHERYIPMPPGPEIDWAQPGDIEHILKLYLGDVTHTDEMVGRVLEALDRLGVADDTLVIALSDHGEPFGDHGTIRKFNVPVYEELARMVWIMRLPGVIPPGQESLALVQNTDFAPTLLEFCGIPIPPRKGQHGFDNIAALDRLDGLSLARLAQGEEDRVRDCVFNGAFGLRASIRTAQHKFIDNRGEKPNELFDLDADPQERTNLAAREPDLVRDLHRRLWEFQRQWAGALAWRDRPAGE